MFHKNLYAKNDVSSFLCLVRIDDFLNFFNILDDNNGQTKKVRNVKSYRIGAIIRGGGEASIFFWINNF